MERGAGDVGEIEAQDSIGAALRRHREERGLTVQQAAQQSKVPLRLVQVLESDDYHLLPDPLYLVRLLREYGAFLTLDPVALEAEFRVAIRRPPRVSLAVSNPPHPTPHISWKHVLWTAVAIAVATPLVFIALSLASKRATDRVVQTQAVEPRKEAGGQSGGEGSDPADRRLESVQPSTSDVPSVSPGEIAVPAQETANTSKAVETPAPLAAIPQATPASHVLIVRAVEPTWMSVRADQKERKQVLLQSGHEARFDAETRFQVTVGNAGGVTLWLDGRMLPALGRSGEVVRDLLLPPVRNDLPSSGPAPGPSKSS